MAQTVRRRATLLHTAARLTPGLFLAASVAGAGTAHAQSRLPVNGNVAAGAASISTGPSTVTVTQSSQRAIINWQTFDVGAGNRVVFAQPGAQASTLNRVRGDTSSTIAGEISANGAVYLINPNGIAITRTGSVQTGGGFVASTLDIADADFAAGRLNFVGTGASKGVGNAGRIDAGTGAYVALLGGTVTSSGTISVPFGKVGIGAGEQIALDINGDGFLRVAVPVHSGNNTRIDMAGTITAPGGLVQIQAATLRDAVRGIVNVPGSISADSAVGDGGRIILFGGDDGAVTASGTLSARATGANGHGGTIETSGASVDFTGVRVDTSAVGGTTGSWLVDPTDLTVDAAAAATISANLATSNVTLQTTATAATGPGNQSSGNGDITVAAPLGWTGTNTLSLLAYNNIALNAAISAPTGGLTLTAGNGVAKAGAISTTGAITIGTFNLTNGSWTQNSATLPAFSAVDFRFSPANAAFLRVTGGTGAMSTPYQIADAYGLQGMASFKLLTNSFVLANNIDASGTVTWNAGAGFVPIGTDGQGNVLNNGVYGFSGSLNGNSFAVSGLDINRNSSFNGLFGYAHAVNISNLAMNGGNIFGGNDTGALIGSLDNSSSTISNISSSASVTGIGSSSDYIGGLIGFAQKVIVIASSASGAVSGNNDVGGLAGYLLSGSVIGSSASGMVLGSGDRLGGLIGGSGVSITTSYATGNVTYTGPASQSYNVGGLVGSSNAAITNSYATGAVTGSSGANSTTGGLIGLLQIGPNLTRSYATGAVSAGGGSIGGLVGAAQVSSSEVYATGNVTGTGSSGYVGGLIGASMSNLSDAWASGAVGGGSSRGGVVGSNSKGSSIDKTVYWDVFTTGQNSAVGYNGTIFNAVGVTSDPTKMSQANYAYKTSAYANLTAANWVFFDGQTRPFGSWEMPAAGSAITNSHQLQLISAPTGAALGGNFTLGSNIDLTETGKNQGTAATSAGMWASTGFVPIGTDGVYRIWNGTAFDGNGATGFSGTLDGKGYTLTGLTVARGGIINVGLFGYLSGAVSNLALSGATIAGLVNVGPLAGTLRQGSVSNVAVGATTTGNTNVGGIVGLQVQGTVVGSASSGAVGGYLRVGGITGLEQSGTIGNSSSAATITGLGVTSLYIGGIIGYQANSTANSNISSSGAVSGWEGVGGVAGYVDASNNAGSPTMTAPSASLLNTYASGTVTGTYFVGGLIGLLGNGATLAQSFATGAVKGEGHVGGVAGYVYGASVSDSYATGAVTGTIHVGGLVGTLDGATATIARGYAVGLVTGTVNVGGLLGNLANGGVVAASFYDSLTTGRSYSAGAGGVTGVVTSTLQDAVGATGLFTGWDFGGVWTLPNQAGQSGIAVAHYPRLSARPSP